MSKMVQKKLVAKLTESEGTKLVRISPEMGRILRIPVLKSPDFQVISKINYPSNHFGPELETNC